MLTLIGGLKLAQSPLDIHCLAFCISECDLRSITRVGWVQGGTESDTSKERAGRLQADEFFLLQYSNSLEQWWWCTQTRSK